MSTFAKAMKQPAPKAKDTGAPHQVVMALAGVGKTTTMLWGIGGVPKGIKLSDEQEAIIDTLNAEKYRSARIMAFNKAIAKEIQVSLDRMQIDCAAEASTFHSFGLSCLRRLNRRINIDQYKYEKIIREDILKGTSRLPYRTWRSGARCCDMIRSNMMGEIVGDMLIADEDDVAQVIGKYGIEPPEGSKLSFKEFAGFVVKALKIGTPRTDWVDFSDMIWMPVAHDIPVPKSDIAIVDEAQDLDAGRRALALMSGHRLNVVGDGNQAIYAFAGADSDSLQIMIDRLKATKRGVKVLPLTTTRRCGRKIVERAQVRVPSYKAAEDNCEGEVIEISHIEVRKVIKELTEERALGDTLVLCRNNAPSVRLAFWGLRENLPVQIQGRDFGTNLISLVGRIGGKTTAEFQEGLGAYQASEQQRILGMRYGMDEQLELLNDKCDCLEAFAEGTNNVDEITRRIENLFNDYRQSGVLTLSSVHKSKGMESKYVIIYRKDLLPHPRLVEKVNGSQEYNLEYVAMTRAIEKLWIAAGPSKDDPRDE